MCEMIAELNLPLATASSLTGLFCEMFPDLQIVKGLCVFFIRVNSFFSFSGYNKKCFYIIHDSL